VEVLEEVAAPAEVEVRLVLLTRLVAHHLFYDVSAASQQDSQSRQQTEGICRQRGQTVRLVLLTRLVPHHLIIIITIKIIIIIIINIIITIVIMIVAHHLQAVARV
jgi:hypothetical protein